MTSRNPYENGVDIPGFVDKKDDDIDMSVFNAVDNQDDDYDDEDDYYDDEPKKLSSKGITVILMVACAVLLISTIASLAYGLNKGKDYKQLLAEHTSLKTNYEETSKKVDELNNEIKLLKAASSEGESTGEGETSQTKVTYKMTASVGVRKTPEPKEYASFSKLPSEVADLLLYDDAQNTLTTKVGAVLTVYETKEVSGNVWGRIADNAWVALKYGGENWGVKQ